MQETMKCLKCKKTITENRTGYCVPCRSIKCLKCGVLYTPVAERNKLAKVCLKCKRNQRRTKEGVGISADMRDAIYG